VLGLNDPTSRLVVQQTSPPRFPKELDLTATVIICTRNRPAFLRKCLEGVAALHPGADVVLVIDNTQGDRETEAIARHFSARYIVEPNTGLSHARNRGLAESESDIVAYLDDDAIPDPNWLRFLLAPFEDANVAAATGRILTPESDCSKKEPPRYLSNKDSHWFEIATFGGLGLGSNMALRRAACNGWTAFDERLGRGAPFQIAEENYAFARLLSLGYKAVYLPAAIVLHPSLHRRSIEQEARNSFVYWLLLFSEFPARRFDLLRFLFRRLARKHLEWSRDSVDPGEIITSDWLVLLKAGLSALFLFLRTKKPKRK
jgi:glycosyltransferase involved in cell wall biosynthesis